jgi:hypothetical protein
MKRLTLIVLIAAVGGFVVWLAFHRRSTPVAEEPIPQPPSSVTTNDERPISTTSQIVTQTDVFSRPPGFDEGKWIRAMTMRQRILERNQPVAFYARVVDQNGNPVEGAKVTLKLLRVNEEVFATTNFFHMQMGDEMTNTVLELVSNAQGLFQLVGVTGFSLDVLRVEKESYISKYTNSYHGGISYEPGGRRNPVYDALMSDALNPAKRYTFHLWKKGETERLIHFQFRVPVDFAGTNWYSVEFFRGVATNELGGDFRFWFVTTNDLNGNPARLFRFESPEGGLQLHRQPYGYEPPAEGYLQTLDWFYQPQAANNKDNATQGLVKQFFIRSREGKVYANLTWNFTAGNAAAITGYANPNGSRNLEPDPEKEITNPEEIRRLAGMTKAK